MNDINAFDNTVPYREKYGAWETNGLVDAQAEVDSIDRDYISFLTDPNLKMIYRLRLLSDPGHPVWDLSYCYGVLKDGRKVRVQLPWGRFPKKNLKAALIQMCQEEGVFAKGLGLLDDDVISKCQ